MSESNSYRNYQSPTGNIIPTGLLKNPIGLSIFPVGESILLWELSFSDGILIFKGKYLTCQVKHTKNKSGYILSRQWSIIWHTWIFPKLHLKRVQKCHLGTGIIIRHSVRWLCTGNIKRRL